MCRAQITRAHRARAQLGNNQSPGAYRVSYSLAKWNLARERGNKHNRDPPTIFGGAQRRFAKGKKNARKKRHDGARHAVEDPIRRRERNSSSILEVINYCRMSIYASRLQSSVMHFYCKILPFARGQAALDVKATHDKYGRIPAAINRRADCAYRTR